MSIQKSSWFVVMMALFVCLGLSETAFAQQGAPPTATKKMPTVTKGGVVELPSGDSTVRCPEADPCEKPKPENPCRIDPHGGECLRRQIGWLRRKHNRDIKRLEKTHADDVAKILAELRRIEEESKERDRGLLANDYALWERLNALQAQLTELIGRMDDNDRRDDDQEAAIAAIGDSGAFFTIGGGIGFSSRQPYGFERRSGSESLGNTALSADSATDVFFRTEVGWKDSDLGEAGVYLGFAKSVIDGDVDEQEVSAGALIRAAVAENFTLGVGVGGYQRGINPSPSDYTVARVGIEVVPQARWTLADGEDSGGAGVSLFAAVPLRWEEAQGDADGKSLPPTAGPSIGAQFGIQFSLEP